MNNSDLMDIQETIDILKNLDRKSLALINSNAKLLAARQLLGEEDKKHTEKEGEFQHEGIIT